MRDYDPTTGRYLEADPLGLVDGASVYGYVKQSPMRFTDPSGQSIGEVIVGGIGVGIDWGAGVVAGGILGTLGLIFYPTQMGDGTLPDQAVPTQPQQCTEENSDCEQLNRIDTDTCTGIGRIRGKRAAAICHASASQRYAACRAGKPLPPLNTWNN